VVDPINEQTADTIAHENLVRMLSRLHPQSLRNAVWIASPSALEALYGVSFPVKAANGDIVAGEAAPASYNAQGGEFRLMGLPLVVSESAAALGDVGDIILADMSQYAVAIRRQVSVAVDTSSKFDFDLVRYRLTVRIAGQPMWSSAMQPKAGATLSPFVTLAAR
jgi:HK97 family phage major capsid protein